LTEARRRVDRAAIALDKVFANSSPPFRTSPRCAPPNRL